MNKKLSVLIMLLAMTAVLSCTKKEDPEIEATVSLSSIYADMTGEEGSTATVVVTANYDDILVEKDAAADWFSLSIDENNIITTTALSVNDGDEERWCKVNVTVFGISETNFATTSFTARQSINSDAVKVIFDKTQPILSAAAYGETAGYGETDNRYILGVTMVNTDDFNISWTADWITNVEKYYTVIDETESYLSGIMISVTKNDGTESREGEITISVDGADYATRILTVNQKSNPFGFAVGDYDAVNGGTVIYLDIERYNFYLVLDNVESKLPFMIDAAFDVSGAASYDSTGVNATFLANKFGADFVPANFPALFYSFNRNAPEGTEYTTFSEVPTEVVNDQSYWHMMSRDELAYVFKRTLYESYVPAGATEHTFNAVLQQNASDNGVEIADIPVKGIIYWSSFTGTQPLNVTGYATTNLNSSKKNQYNGYRGTETTKSFVRCVKKIVVDDNE